MGANQVDQHVGRQLRSYREAASLTVEDLASAIGQSPFNVAAYERGRRIDAASLFEICRSTGLKVGYFYEGLYGQAPAYGQVIAFPGPRRNRQHERS